VGARRVAAGVILASLMLTGCFGVRPLRPEGWLEALWPGAVRQVDLTATYYQYRPPRVVHAVLTHAAAIGRLVAAIDALPPAPPGPESCGSVTFGVSAGFVYAGGRRIRVDFLPACGRVAVDGRGYVEGAAWTTLLEVLGTAKLPVCLPSPCG
jgi:hypothetical protein